MSPFDIVLFARGPVVQLTKEEKAAAAKAARKAREQELRAAAYGSGRQRDRNRRGANPQYAKKEVAAPSAPTGTMAEPRTRNWKTGEYKHGTQMRDAIDRARAEQPTLMTILSKEKV